MRWSTHHGEGRTLRIGVCIRCEAQVSCNTRPRPNEIDIGGDAVAINCPPRISPKEAIDRIHAQLSGLEWSPDTLDVIAGIVRLAGYTIAEPA